LFEIVPSSRWVEPSQEARSNPFLALDRWLTGTGRQIRVLDLGNLRTLLEAPEKTVYIEDSCFSWEAGTDQEESAADAMLTSWIQEGAKLIVSLNNSYGISWRMAKYLDGLGIEPTGFADELNGEDEEDEAGEDEAREAGAEEAGETDAEETGEAEAGAETEEQPYFDWNTSFRINETAPEVDRISIMTAGQKNAVKLVTLHMGKGTITFTGTSYFLRSTNLYNRKNAELAVTLLADPDEQSGNRGILFIRGFLEERHLFGNLADRGDLRPLVISILLLIVLGFWMVVPSFGRFKPVFERPGKPLRERFLAEGQFLKKYQALDKYRDAYAREVEQICMIRGVKPPVSGAKKKSDIREFMQYQREAMNILGEKENHGEKS
jgi:hypothetical protein